MCEAGDEDRYLSLYNGNTFEFNHPDVFRDRAGCRYLLAKDDPLTSPADFTYLFDYRLPSGTKETGETDFKPGNRVEITRVFPSSLQTTLSEIRMEVPRGRGPPPPFWLAPQWLAAIHGMALKEAARTRPVDRESYIWRWERVAWLALSPASAQITPIEFEVQEWFRVDPQVWQELKKQRVETGDGDERKGPPRTLQSTVCGRVLLKMSPSTWRGALQLLPIGVYMRVPKLARILDKEQAKRVEELELVAQRAVVGAQPEFFPPRQA